MKREIRSAFSDRKPVNNPVSGEPSRVKQEFQDEVNINTIVRKMRNGISPPAWMTAATPRYGDFTGMPTSFQDAYNLIERAEEAFRSLPLEFRRAIDHNPANIDRAPRELFEQFGLLKKPAGAESPTGDVDPVGTQRVQGDRDLPAKSPQGSKNRVQKPVNDAEE